jgi:alanine racemase
VNNINSIAVRPIRAEISRSALRHNYRLAKQRAPHSKLLAVVKACAYGHGIDQALNAWRDADGFALVELEAAIRLRQAGVTAPILLLEGFFSEEEIPLLEKHRLATVIHHDAQLAMLQAATLQQPLDVFLKFNTGMNRLGFAPHMLDRALGILGAKGKAASITLMTHFAAADDAAGIEEPLRRFREIDRQAAQSGYFAGQRPAVSMANSAALLRSTESHGDWVRPGIMLYGSSPFADQSAAQIGLKPAMTLRSRIISIQNVRPGDSVGYGAAFRAERPMRIGIVACGYADGYPRHAPNGMPMLVEGVRTRTVGRVSMDMLAADISGIPMAGLMSPVTLWGEGLSVDEVAAAAETVGYELLCALAPRVPIIEVGL